MKRIVALGFFDGVHLGHQALLEACCRMAKDQGAIPCAITFGAHPQALFTANPPKLINHEQDRIRLMEQYGIEAVTVYPVTEAVMSMAWDVFLEELVARETAGFVCGSDFRFGCRGLGDSEKLKGFCRDRGLSCQIIDQQMLSGIRISSTHIRSLLEQGQMEQAAAFLGHPHVLSGTVQPGKQLGRTLGIPTANLSLPENVVCPKFGVYACRARTQGKSYLAVTNVGMRPTVSGNTVTVEPWLLDFSGDLYGKELTLEFYSFLRPERKFESLEVLAEEIRKNAAQTRKFFEKS